MEHTDKLGTEVGIPNGEETAGKDTQLEKLRYRLVLVHCTGQGQQLTSTHVLAALPPHSVFIVTTPPSVTTPTL